MMALEPARKIYWARGLTFRMARMVVIVSMCIGLILSCTQILLDYQEEKKAITYKFDELVASVKPSAEAAVYEVDTKLTKQIALGLLDNKAIVRVTITDKLAGELVDLSRPVQASSFEWLTRLLFGDLVQKTLPLFDIKQKEVITGELLIVLNPNHFTSDFLDRAVLVLISGFFRISILALITFILFYRLLTKPLKILARDIMSIDPLCPGEKKLSVPRGHDSDELGELVNAFNFMDQSLLSAQQELLSYNRELEIKVEQRTVALMEANGKLKDEINQRKDSEERLRILSHYDEPL